MSRVGVIGGGLTGLVAARDLARAGTTVVLVECDRLGGKLRTTPFAGGALDEAADAFLARVPEGIELCRELGLAGDLVSPAARRARVWSRGGLRLLPEGQVLGVPTDLDELAESEIVSSEGVARARLDLTMARTAVGDDVAIGSFLRARLGDEVTERLVDPLVGGINAGDTDRLSLAATVPQLDAAARGDHASLVEACRAQRTALRDPTGPVFFAPRQGMGALPAALAADLDSRGAEVVRDRACGLDRDGAGWRVALSSGTSLAVEGVLIATPAPTASSLLATHAPRASSLLATIPYASVALVSVAVARDGIDRELDASGFLVPRVEDRVTTACSWTTSKWPHLGGDGVVWLRASVGRDGPNPGTALPDDILVATVLGDLRDTMALRGMPTETRVSRWPGSFPQYRPGHLGRVAAIESEVTAAGGLEVAGAALAGLGVPACIRQGRRAAGRILAALDH